MKDDSDNIGLNYAENDPVLFGTIEHISDKGYGFIKVPEYDNNVYFHAKDLRRVSFEQVRKGDKVRVVSITLSEKNDRYKANDVFLIQ